MAILMTIFFAALALMGAIPVIYLGLMLRWYVIRRASLAAALAVSHAIITAIDIALYLTPIFWSNIHGFDDIYWIFMFIPGVHIYQLGRLIAYSIAPHLDATMSYHSASIMILVIIPGIICLLLGTLQWYLIGRVCQWLWHGIRASAP
jgi:hypothetical protein